MNKRSHITFSTSNIISLFTIHGEDRLGHCSQMKKSQVFYYTPPLLVADLSENKDEPN